MNEEKKPLTVDCPTCGRQVEWLSTSLFRPFCCERCKLIDLGEWAGEERRIPGSTEDNDWMSEDH